MKAVAALYVDVERGPYAQMQGVDAWGVERDARLYAGPHPVVAHPPCGGWGLLRMSRHHIWGKNGWSTPELDREASEMSCGPIAVRQVRQFGGVLEHPAHSMLWDYCSMPRPGLFSDSHGGFTVVVWQGAYGHDAPKKTWLYCVDVDRGALDLRGFADPGGRVQSMWSSKRHLTPQPFAELLVEYLRVGDLKDPKRHIYRARNIGVLQGRIVSKRLLFKREWLDEYIENHCGTGRGEGATHG